MDNVYMWWKINQVTNNQVLLSLCYRLFYCIAISSKTIILSFMQPVSCIYKIYDLSSFVFDHNSTKDSIAWRNIVYISHSINLLSVLEITACFQSLPKPPRTFTRNLLQICWTKTDLALPYNVCYKQVSIRQAQICTWTAQFATLRIWSRIAIDMLHC